MRGSLTPAVDVTKDPATVFDYGADETAGTTVPRSMTLANSEVLECGAV